MAHSAGQVMPTIRRIGDQALLIGFGDGYGATINRAVQHCDQLVTSAAHPAIVETVPTMRSLLVRFDPAVTAGRVMAGWLDACLAGQDWANPPPSKAGANWTLPVLYGGAHGPDLDRIADLAGRSANEMAHLHAISELDVLCLGFAPGLAYLAQLHTAFDLPRRDSFGDPVPRGAILVANRQMVLPANPIPTGWWWIGTTPVRSFRPDHARPFLLSPGDRVTFRSISESAYATFVDDDYWC